MRLECRKRRPSNCFYLCSVAVCAEAVVDYDVGGTCSYSLPLHFRSHRPRHNFLHPRCSTPTTSSLSSRDAASEVGATAILRREGQPPDGNSFSAHQVELTMMNCCSGFY